MTTLDDPLAPAGAQFPLGRPDDAAPSSDEPSPPGVRPWGLRRMGLVMRPQRRWLAWGYDHEMQLGTGHEGVPLDLVSGPPTAPTTQTVDGEDPPSSEDWINDYTPDEPFPP